MEREEGAGAGAEAPRGRDKILCYINMQSPGNGTKRSLTQSCWGSSQSEPRVLVTWTFGQVFPADKLLHLYGSVHVSQAEVDSEGLQGCFDLHQTSCWLSSEIAT